MISWLAPLTLFLALPFFGSQQPYALPPGAVVIETTVVPRQWAAGRSLILWMVRPRQNALASGVEEYTCPDETRGSYYSGPTRVSLVNTRTGKIINTVRVREEPTADTFDVPYEIRGSYYQVDGVAKGVAGKPTLMDLKDYNGDGKALEFAFFDAVACMGLETTLLGYSQRQDRAIQYPVLLSVGPGSRGSREVRYWIDYLFSKTPLTPGHWQYEIDYRGRGGRLDRYKVHYNASLERFEGTFDSRP